MWLIVCGLGLSGYLMSVGWGGETTKEIHEVLANGFAVVVVLHLAGIILHTLRHRDAIWYSMVGGTKRGLPDETSEVPRRGMVGIVLTLSTFFFFGFLMKNYDSKAQNLYLFGQKLHLGEFEAGEEEHHHGHSSYREAGDDDD